MTSLAQAVAEQRQQNDQRTWRTGRVTATDPGDNRLTVEVDGGSLRLPYVSNTYAVNDIVTVICNAREWKVAGPDGSLPPPPPPTPVPPPVAAPSLFTVALTPIWTGSFRNGAYRGDTSNLVQGDSPGGSGLNTGAAYYGDQVVALGAVASPAPLMSVRMRRVSGGVNAAQSPTVRTIQQHVPSGAPVLLSSTTGPAMARPGYGATDGTAVLTAAMVDELRTGSAAGVGIHVAGSTPYIRLAGTPDWAAAMVLDVAYYR